MQDGFRFQYCSFTNYNSIRFLIIKTDYSNYILNGKRADSREPLEPKYYYNI